MNSSMGMLVEFSINFHLFVIPSIARSRGMFVKSDTTSREMSILDIDIDIPERVL